MNPNWIRVTRAKPCPICGKPDYCGISADGTAVICMRTESQKTTKQGGWLHKLADPIPKARLPKKQKPKPVNVDMEKLAMKFKGMCDNAHVLSQQLGVSEDSLRRLEIGWTGSEWVFPMRNATERIIGLKKRNPATGEKICVLGSSLGIYWPLEVTARGKDLLFIAEGESDTASLLDMGFTAIGRPSCSSCVEIIKDFLSKSKRPVVIFSDKDEPHYRPDGSTYFPGQDGAKRLAKEIKPLVQTLKIIKPIGHKDVRSWYNNGCTREKVLAIMKNTMFV